MTTRKRNIVFALLLLISIAPFWLGLGDSSLWDSNEAFYADTPRVMVETGNYADPSFNYQPRFNKPPLSYWLVAGSYQIFGVSEWSERITMAVAAMGLLAAAFVLGRIVFGGDAPFWAVLVLANMPRFLMHSRRIAVDIFLTLFMGLVLTFFALSEARPERRRLWLILMYAAAGLGIMTKGPVAVVLPGIAFLLYLLIERRLGHITKMMVPAGFAIVSAIVLPWYVVIYQRHGWQYIYSFIVNENISRFTDDGWGPRRSFFYPTVLLGDLFPWSLLLLLAIAAVLFWRYFNKAEGTHLTASQPGSRALQRLMAIWIGVIVLFYSLSRNQQDQYVMPTYLAAAVLVAGLIARFIGEADKSALIQKISRWNFILVGMVISSVGGLLIYSVYRSSGLDLRGLALLGSALVIGGVSITAFAVLTRRFHVAAALLATMLLVNWIFVLQTLPDFERFKPVRPLSQAIAEQAGPGASVGFFKTASPSMVFYLRRPIREVFADDEIVDAFGQGREAWFIMRADDYESIRTRLPSATRIVETRPLARIQLKTLFEKTEMPQMVLVTNKF